MKILLSIIFIISINYASSQSINCDCTFANLNYQYFNLVRTCIVTKINSIMNDNTTISSINNNYKDGNPITDAKFFYILSKTAYYIPKGLDNIFENLIGIRFESTKLKHVTKENLRPFPELKMFASVGNNIQFIEKDLFMYTTKIEYVSLRSNQITYIDPYVLNVIQGSLEQFWIEGGGNACGLSDAKSKSDVTRVIGKLNISSCGNIDNAPPLYKFWVNSQDEEPNRECETKLAAKETELTLLKEEMALKDAICEAKIKDLEDMNVQDMKTLLEYIMQIIKCLNSPTSSVCAEPGTLINLEKKLERALKNGSKI